MDRFTEPLLAETNSEDERNNNAGGGSRNILGSNHLVNKERLHNSNYKDWVHRSNGFVSNGAEGVDPSSPSSSSPSNSPSPSNSLNGEPVSVALRLPRERWKTGLAFLFLVTGFLVNAVSIVLTHERIPDPVTNPPLPDFFLDRLDPHKWANDLSDILVLASGLMAGLTIFLHKHRYIIARRAFIILGLLYLMRSVTMFVTNLPLSSSIVKCAPKQNGTISVGVVVQRVFQLFSGMGLPITGMKVVCGDYIYSGHTCILVTAYLFICEYSTKRIVHYAAWLSAFVGMVGVIYSRGHYTVDVILAYYFASRLFWSYHQLCKMSPSLRNANPTDNYISREWWYPLFRFFEGNVRGSIPNKFYKFRPSKHKNLLFPSDKLNV